MLNKEIDELKKLKLTRTVVLDSEVSLRTLYLAKTQRILCCRIKRALNLCSSMPQMQFLHLHKITVVHFASAGILPSVGWVIILFALVKSQRSTMEEKNGLYKTTGYCTELRFWKLRSWLPC